MERNPEVNDPAHAPVEITGTVRHNEGLGAIGWVLLILAVLVAVAYATGLFT